VRTGPYTAVRKVFNARRPRGVGADRFSFGPAPPPSRTPGSPGFRGAVSPGTIRTLPARPSELHSYSPRGRPELSGFSAADRPRDSALYLPFPSVRAFDVAFPALRSLTVSALSGQCLDRAGRLPTPTMPSADFCPPVRKPRGFLSPAYETAEQISRGKFDRLPRTTAEFTLRALDGYGLRHHLLARPTLAPRIRFLSVGSRVGSTLPSDPASRRRPCASLILHLHQVG